MQFYKNINCWICNNKDFIILKKGDYSKYSKKEIINLFSSSSDHFIDQVVQCKNCKFVYLNPRLDTKIILHGYSNVVDKKFITQDHYRLKTFTNSLKKLKFFLNFNKKNILDVGTANGTFIKACLKEKINADGIEPSKWLVNQAKLNDNINLYCGTFEKYKFKKKYDYIFFWDVLEHVFNIKVTRNKITKILKKNGHLIINCPDYNSLARKFLNFKWPFFLSVHLYYFEEKSLKTLFNNDFIFVKSFPHFQYLELNYVLKRASKYFHFFKFLIKLCKFIKIDKIPIKYNMGQTTYIFKKK